MIDREHELPIKQQAELLKISRGTVYYHPEPVRAEDLALMRRIDESRAHKFLSAPRDADRLIWTASCPCPTAASCFEGKTSLGAHPAVWNRFMMREHAARQLNARNGGIEPVRGFSGRAIASAKAIGPMRDRGDGAARGGRR